MLIEVKDVRQFEGKAFRRWFCDENIDLIVWYGPEKDITGFQLCYKKDGSEKALTWKEGAGFSHDGIDGGEDRPPLSYKMTPVLVPDGVMDAKDILALFEKESGEIDPLISSFVRRRILDYAESGL